MDERREGEEFSNGREIIYIYIYICIYIYIYIYILTLQLTYNETRQRRLYHSIVSKKLIVFSTFDCL